MNIIMEFVDIIYMLLMSLARPKLMVWYGCMQVFVASNDLRVQEAASQPTRMTFAVTAEHLLKDMAKVTSLPDRLPEPVHKTLPGMMVLQTDAYNGERGIGFCISLLELTVQSKLLGSKENFYGLPITLPRPRSGQKA